MVDLYSGTPGSGKSLHVARTIYWHLKLGKPVVCNFDLARDRLPHPELFHCITNDTLTPAYLITFSQQYFSERGRDASVRDEERILLVIDEAQLLFNARAWQLTDAKGWLSFFTQHRKLCYHVILVAQFDRMLDRYIRSIIENEYIHRKMSNFGLKGWLLSLVLGGRVHVAVKMWYPLNERLGSEIFHVRKKYYRLYDTFGTFKKA